MLTLKCFKTAFGFLFQSKASRSRRSLFAPLFFSPSRPVSDLLVATFFLTQPELSISSSDSMTIIGFVEWPSFLVFEIMLISDCCPVLRRFREVSVEFALAS